VASQAALVERLLEALTLKELPRAGWLRVGVAAPESVAAHAWGVAWLVLALAPPEVDRGRALAMAVLHDLGEVRVGDITPHDGVDASTKGRLEGEALAELLAPLSHREELLGLWRELEHASSPEARFVKACDKLDMALQASHYRRARGIDTGQLVASALAALADHELAALVGEAWSD
jgi:putative hydrolase of HD superfamily